jgi:hypothetical protein
MPRMLSGIVTELVAGEPDLAIVGEVADADVAVARFEPDRATELFEARPGLRLLTISADGRRVSALELRLHERFLGELSPKLLLSAIRQADPA